MAAQAEIEHPRKAFGWAARDSSGLLSPFNFCRRFSSSLRSLHTYGVLLVFWW